MIILDIPSLLQILIHICSKCFFAEAVLLQVFQLTFLWLSMLFKAFGHVVAYVFIMFNIFVKVFGFMYDVFVDKGHNSALWIYRVAVVTELLVHFVGKHCKGVVEILGLKLLNRLV